MKSRIQQLFALALLSTFTTFYVAQPSTCFAQGTAFTYQGRLNDGANPATGIYDLRFAIYGAGSGGGAVAGPVTNSATPVTNGLFCVTLDFGGGVFTGPNRWLEIAARTNGPGSPGFTTLAPRQALTPVPYALYAPSAGSAASVSGGVSASQITGTLALAQLPAAVLTNNEQGVSLSGSFTGNGAGLTSLNGAAIAAGTVTGSQIASNTITSANVADGSLTAQDFTSTSRLGFIEIPDPAPAAGDYFGVSVAGVGTNRFVIGAYGRMIGGNGNVGQAYLYDAGGTLLATITNPAPAASDDFGAFVTGVGTNRFVIVAPNKMIGGKDEVGQAYLYDTGGALLATITNPAPAASDQFGAALAGVGTNRFVIGAIGKTIGGNSSAGQAYLYDAGGALLATITNPAPASGDLFGCSVTGVGTNRFVIGALGKTIGGNAGVGQAYLYDAGGTLLATITNPAPAYYDLFGTSMAGVGTNRFLIGAYNKTIGGNHGAGQAYLYDAGGTLLTTITNPAPGVDDNFGYSVAGVGTNRFLIGAVGKTIGGHVSAGQAYLYDAGGTLLATITNPAPATGDDFGLRLAGVGTNRFVIGACYKMIGGNSGVGQAYLYDTTVSTPGLIADGVAPNSVGLQQLDITSVDTRYVLKTGDTMTGPLNVNATITASSFAGSGAGLTSLNASQLASGTVADARLSTNVALRNANQTFSGANTFAGSVTLSNTVQVGTNVFMNDSDIQLRGDRYHGLGWYGSTKPFAGATPDGPVVYGYTGGALGYKNNNLGTNLVLFWNTSGNVGIGTNNPNQKLVVAGNIYATGTIIPNSDRNLKTDFAPVDAATVLDRVARLPIQQWRFQAEPEAVKHIGPMAQDFRAAFGLGEIPTAIATVDADGVALAAIQGLNQKLNEKDAEIQALSRKVDTQNAENAELKTRLEKLEQLIHEKNGGGR